MTTLAELTRRETGLRLLADHYRYLAREAESERSLDADALAGLDQVADEDRLDAWGQHVEARNAIDAEVAAYTAQADDLIHAADRAAAAARRLAHEDLPDA
jgi:hypothetical protein